MKTYCTILALLTSIFFSAQESSDSLVIAKIEIEQNENMFTFTSVVQNLSSLHLSYDYLFLIQKKERGHNTSTNTQRGKFTLAPEETKTLSKSRINLQHNTIVNAYLYIRDEAKNQLIAKDTITLKGSELVAEEDPTLNLLKGLVIDGSKTKFGKDFYDEFTAEYRQYPKKFDFAIRINEMPFRALTSKIEIKVDYKTIYAFLSNPNREYLKSQVSMALRYLKRYAKEKEGQQNEFKY